MQHPYALSLYPILVPLYLYLVNSYHRHLQYRDYYLELERAPVGKAPFNFRSCCRSSKVSKQDRDCPLKTVVEREYG
jgi:hypothetical protein